MDGIDLTTFFTDIKNSISSLKDEVQGQNNEMIAMREEISRLSEKYEALNKRDDASKAESVPGNNELSGQTAQDSGSSKISDGNGEAAGLCVVPLPPPSDKQHPSRCARSSDDIVMEKESAVNLMEKSTFEVSKNKVGLSETPVWIGGFDEIKTENKYMNATTGVYTCPATREFEFRVDSSAKTDCNLYLCSDRGEKRQEITSLMRSTRLLWYASLRWKCEKNERIWLEGETDKPYMSIYVELYGRVALPTEEDE